MFSFDFLLPGDVEVVAEGSRAEVLVTGWELERKSEYIEVELANAGVI